MIREIKKFYKKKAFTLIELLVVVAIIGILAAVGVVAYDRYTVGVKKMVTKTQFYTFVEFVESTLALCYMGNEYVKLMNKSEDTTYYKVSCKQYSNGRGMDSGGMLWHITNHLKNSAGGSKHAKQGIGLGWLNPYAEGGILRGKKVKYAWGPGNAWSMGPKGAIAFWTKKNPATGENNIMYIETQYDDSNEPRWCKKNCVKLTKEIVDYRKK